MMGYRYTVDLIALGPQGYYNNTLFYTTNDMKAGGWISGTIGGFAWKITQIFSSDGTNITVQLEDEENYNYNIDAYGNGGAPLFAQPFIYFELSPEGLPIFTPRSLPAPPALFCLALYSTPRGFRPRPALGPFPQPLDCWATACTSDVHLSTAAAKYARLKQMCVYVYVYV